MEIGPIIKIPTAPANKIVKNGAKNCFVTAGSFSFNTLSTLEANQLINIIGISVEVYPVAGNTTGKPKNVLNTCISNGLPAKILNNASPEFISDAIFGNINTAPKIIPTNGSIPNATALVYPKITGKNVKHAFPIAFNKIFVPEPACIAPVAINTEFNPAIIPQAQSTPNAGTTILVIVAAKRFINDPFSLSVSSAFDPNLPSLRIISS